MSDPTKVMECCRHGRSHATFVCGHLVQGVGRGFVATSAEPGDPRPDAWCAHCDEVFQAETGWNDVSESYAEITVICAGCYDEARSRNLRSASPEAGAGFRCETCGEWHEGMSKDFGYAKPFGWEATTSEDRLEPDFATMGEDRFIRTILELPVHGGASPLVLGVWVTQSKASFEGYLEGMKTGRGHALPPSFGFLASSVLGFPDSLMLKTRVHQLPGKLRPWIELEPTDHPLAQAFWHGLSPAEEKRLIARFLHPRD
jgi:hypothetical protein